MVDEGEAAVEKQEAAEEEAVGLPLANVGTLTASDGEGTSFAESFRLGPLLYSSEGTPPSVVLDACGANYSTTIDQAVYSRGEVAISYREGGLATTVPIVPNETVNGDGYLGVTAFQVDGDGMRL